MASCGIREKKKLLGSRGTQRRKALAGVRVNVRFLEKVSTKPSPKKSHTGDAIHARQLRRDPCGERGLLAPSPVLSFHREVFLLPAFRSHTDTLQHVNVAKHVMCRSTEVDVQLFLPFPLSTSSLRCVCVARSLSPGSSCPAGERKHTLGARCCHIMSLFGL